MIRTANLHSTYAFTNPRVAKSSTLLLLALSWPVLGSVVGQHVHLLFDSVRAAVAPQHVAIGEIIKKLAMAFSVCIKLQHCCKRLLADIVVCRP